LGCLGIIGSARVSPLDAVLIFTDSDKLYFVILKAATAIPVGPYTHLNATIKPFHIMAHF
jgi:hypothetical protein